VHPPSQDRLTKPARADINRAVDLYGNTYLHALCRNGAPLALVAEAVRTLGADVNARNNAGYSPLRYAVEFGNAETAAYLLKHGARARHDAGQGKTYNAVIGAVYRGRSEMMDAVLKNGGAALEDVAHVTAYVKDNSQREALNAEWLLCFPDPHDRPARHTQVTDLQGGMLMQIEIIAVVQEH
jgi:2-iminobutanoate/2-iminopropanoate deaminase